MAKPYSDLEKQALAIIRGGGDPSTSQDEGLANFWKWKLNPAATSHDLPSESALCRSACSYSKSKGNHQSALACCDRL